MVKQSSWIKLFRQFINELRISSKDVSNRTGEGTKLILWESQDRFLKEVGEGLDNGIRIFYCLKSRQLGVTTISLAIDLFWLAVHPGIVGALVTEDEGNRDKNRKVIEQYMTSFPPDYFGEGFRIEKTNRNFILFSNGSRLDFKVAGTKRKSTSWGEGEGYAFAHLTEVASYGDMDGLRSFEESFSQVNPDRLYIYESTAKGFNLWRDKWLSGFADVLTKRSFFIGWWSNPSNSIAKNDPRFAKYGLDARSKEEREKIKLVKEKHDFEISSEQVAWYRWRSETDDGGSDMLSQNHPWTANDAFITSGQSFFQVRTITNAIKRMEDNPEEYGYLSYAYDYGNTFFEMKLRYLDGDSDPDDIELRVWEEPVDGGKYVIGCDPAYGRNEHKDNICISVWRCYADKLIQVAEYCTYQVEVKYAAWALAHLAGAYKDCIVNGEVYGGGSVIINEWDNLRSQLNSEMYARYTKSGNWEDALDQARWYLWSRSDSVSKSSSAYWMVTNHKLKQELMFSMRGAFTTGELIIRSRRLLNEMSIVIQDGSTIGAPESRDPNSKDDRVFATSFAIRAWNEWIRKAQIANNESYEMVSKTERGEITRSERTINGLIHRFWQMQEILSEAGEAQLTWRQERGLE